MTRGYLQYTEDEPSTDRMLGGIVYMVEVVGHNNISKNKV